MPTKLREIEPPKTVTIVLEVADVHRLIEHLLSLATRELAAGVSPRAVLGSSLSDALMLMQVIGRKP